MNSEPTASGSVSQTYGILGTPEAPKKLLGLKLKGFTGSARTLPAIMAKMKKAWVTGKRINGYGVQVIPEHHVMLEIVVLLYLPTYDSSKYHTTF